jgi:hypothetical protein
MKLTVLRSVGPQKKRDHYTIAMNTSYGDRFLGHIRDRGNFCHSCGDGCISCRHGYELDFTESIAQIIDVPALLSIMIDEPQAYLPDKVAKHDVLIAISVHEEILVSFVERLTTASGIIVPVEEPGWISPYVRGKLQAHCNDRGIEIAFPKPFCSFNPPSGVLKEFKEKLRIGRPDISFHIRKGRIQDARVNCSAPCGATYFVARHMKGIRVDNDVTQSLDSFLSAYPCTASTEVDREFGDSIIHRAVQLQRSVLQDLHLHKAEG